MVEPGGLGVAERILVSYTGSFQPSISMAIVCKY